MKCIFIAYSINSKGHRLWDPNARRIHVSRDVVFFEEDFDGRTSLLQYIERSSESKETLPPSTIEDDTDDQEAVVNNQDAINDNEEERENFAVQQGLERHLKEVISLL